MFAGLEGVSDLCSCDKASQGKPIGDPLGQGHYVWLNTVMLDPEHVAGPAEPGLYFVSDEEDSVPIQNLLDPLEISLRRNDNATFAKHRTGDERGNVS